MNNWILEIGLYPGVLIGVRSYVGVNMIEHVLYIPFIEMCLTIEQ